MRHVWCRHKAQETRTSADSSSDESTSGVETSSRAVAKAPVDPARAAARVAEEAQVAQGQRTAVITGAVSIVFGVRPDLRLLVPCDMWQPEASAVTAHFNKSSAVTTTAKARHMSYLSAAKACGRGASALLRC
jgi:hypothetical protein